MNKHSYFTLIKLLIVILTIISTIWLIHQFWRFIFETSPIWNSSVPGGIDLVSRYKEVNNWFNGLPVYGEIPTAAYPPASYLMLWPLLRWDNIVIIKVIMSVLYLISIIYIIFISLKESKAKGEIEKTLVALTVISIYPTGASIGNGQITLLIFPFLLYGIMLSNSRKSSFRNDILVSALLLVSLIKPNISVPFLLIVLLIPRRFRVIILITCAYIILTFVSITFQPYPPKVILNNWLTSIFGVLFYKDYASYELTNILLGYLFEDLWIIPAAIIVLVLSGLWMHLHRKIDIWIHFSIIAIITNIISYIRWYDDILILIPMITLLRLIKIYNERNTLKIISIILLSVTVLFTLAPGGYYLFPEPYKSVYVVVRNLVCLSDLLFLIFIGWRNRAATEITTDFP